MGTSLERDFYLVPKYPHEMKNEYDNFRYYYYDVDYGELISIDNFTTTMDCSSVPSKKDYSTLYGILAAVCLIAASIIISLWLF